MEIKVERLKVLTSGKELQLAIEGRFTNLRIWNSDGKIYMRLDKLNEYSAPLKFSTIRYLEKENKAVRTLFNEYEFGQAVCIADLNRIIEITIGMKQRDVRMW